MRKKALLCYLRTLVSLFSLLAFFTTQTDAEITGTTRLTGVTQPLFATHVPGDKDRLFIAEREGAIRILDLNTNELLPDPFLSISDVDAAGEGGFLGLAFHPNYATNGKFYTYTTVDNGGIPIDNRTSPFSSRIREYTVSATNPNAADLSSQREILSWAQPQSNHNGGWIGFGPNDGYLYIASGDGGKQNDPDNNANTLSNDLLGKILRLDINADAFPSDPNRNYTPPPTNPFVNETGDDEIWSFGLRNPFRASFDRDTGDLWIGDVGQDQREEINRLPADEPGGVSFGWRDCEGNRQTSGCDNYKQTQQAAGVTVIDPVYDYSHNGGGPSDPEFRGNSVTGGVLYRGPDPDLQGQYFFADFVANRYWRFDSSDPYGTVDNINAELFGSSTIFNPTAFAEDAVGNLYIISSSGGVYRIDTDGLAAGDFNGDGHVDQQDYALWQSTFGSSTELAADGNGNNVIDAADYTIWRDQLAASANASALAVPEPGCAIGSVLVGSLIGLRRRK